tara:strand:+ start:24 stop:1760 length:1737 start_codon:yes stop_codon:yes gene_type:complete
MKLLIILALISSVYCGINNSITVLGNGTIYLAHTNNCAIYKIKNINNSFEKVVVVGDINAEKKGNVNDFNGLNARLTEPRSIINSDDDSLLFFVDDNKFIKRVNISSDSIKGREIEKITDVSSNITNIFTYTSYNYANSDNITRIIYFANLTKIYKIDLSIDPQEEAEETATDAGETVTTSVVTASTNTLASGSNFINISFYNGNLFYCYSNNDIYYFKQSVESNNFNTDTDTTLNITHTPNITDIKGFTFSSNNYLIITGTSNNVTKIQRFTYTISGTPAYNYTPSSNGSLASLGNNYNINNITSNNIQVSDDEYSALVDYKAIYGNDDNDADTYIIGRRSAGIDGFYKININNITNTTPISMSEVYNIDVKNTDGSDYTINSFYLFNNKYTAEPAYNNYRMIHFNKNNSNINLVQYEKSAFRTQVLNFKYSNDDIFHNNYTGKISNITIDKQDTLYIAEYNSSSSSIYYCENIKSRNEQYELKKINTTPEIEGEISSINYNPSNKSLHFITDKHYYKYKILNNNRTIIPNGSLSNLDNIKQTNDTDNLENINDFVIDTDYEVGYIAFEKRLKWFYV